MIYTLTVSFDAILFYCIPYLIPRFLQIPRHSATQLLAEKALHAINRACLLIVLLDSNLFTS